MEVELQSIYHGLMDPNQDWDPDNAYLYQGGALAVVFVVSGLHPQHPKPLLDESEFWLIQLEISE